MDFIPDSKDIALAAFPLSWPDRPQPAKPATPAPRRARLKGLLPALAARLGARRHGFQGWPVTLSVPRIDPAKVWTPRAKLTGRPLD